MSEPQYSGASGLRAGAAVHLLLTAPHLVRPDWLRGDPLGGISAEGGQAPGAPAAGDRERGRVRASPAGVEGAPLVRSVGVRWPASLDVQESRDAVPFAAAAPIAPAVAGRLAAAARALGARILFCCPVEPSRAAQPTTAMPADGTQIHATARRLGTQRLLMVVPDLSALLLSTDAGFAVAAGPRSFVEAAVGADVRRARGAFADFALAARATSPLPLEAAAYYGCPLSSRQWQPEWLAWSHAALVPYGSGIGRQLAAMRRLADGEISAAEFGPIFRAARMHEITTGERATGPLAAALDAADRALDGYIPPGEGWPRAPGELDPAGLREAIAAILGEL